MSLMNAQPQPVASLNPKEVFSIAMTEDDGARAAFLQRLGARNAFPPLPHSPCLKNKKTGVVLPWTDILAEQQEFFDCCDEDGNTDLAAWQDKVISEAWDTGVEQQIFAIKESERKFMEQQNNQYLTTNAVDLTPRPEQYPDDIVPYDQVESLIQQMSN